MESPEDLMFIDFLYILWVLEGTYGVPPRASNVKMMKLNPRPRSSDLKSYDAYDSEYEEDEK